MLNWSDYGGAYTYWADNVWQTLAADKTEAQRVYDAIMTYPKDQRVLGFQKKLDH